MKKYPKTIWTLDENFQLCIANKDDKIDDAYSIEAFSIKEALQQALYNLKAAEGNLKFHRRSLAAAEDKINTLSSRVKELEAKLEDSSSYQIPGRRPMNLSIVGLVTSVRDDLDISLRDAKCLVDYILPHDCQTLNEHNNVLDSIRALIER